MPDQTHKLNQTHNSRSEVAAIVATMSLTAALTVGAGSAYAAEEPDTETATSPEAQETAKAPAATTDAYTVTETVKTTDDTRQTFDTEADAQKYLDNAKAAYEKVDEADKDASYTVTTEGPTEVDKGTTHKETSDVSSGEKTFADKDAAQAYVDDATAHYVDENGKVKDGYTVTSKVEEKKTDKATSTTDEKFKADSKDGFSSQADANKWIDEQVAGCKDGDGVTYTVTRTVTKVDGTEDRTERLTTSDGGTTFTVEQTFETEEAAKAYIQYLLNTTYKGADGVTFTITPTYTKTTVTENGGDKVKKGDAARTDYGTYDSEDAAKNALEAEKVKDKSTDLHDVTFSDIIPKTETTKAAEQKSETSAESYATDAEAKKAAEVRKAELEKAGNTSISYTVNGSGSTTYTNELLDHVSGNVYGPDVKGTTVSGADAVVIKDATGLLVWTAADGIDTSSLLNKIANDISKDNQGKTTYTASGATTISGNTLASYFSNGWKNGSFTATKNTNGTYTVSFDKAGATISHYWIVNQALKKTSDGSYTYTINYKTPAQTKTTYSFTKTVQDYTQPTKSVDKWNVSYTGTKTTKGTAPTYKADYVVSKTEVKPVYEYVASYDVKQTTDVADTAWQAAYGVTKTTTYQIPKPEEPTVPGTPNKPAHTTTVARNATAPQSQTDRGALPAHAEKASAIPQTSDGAQAVSVAGMFAAIGFGGVLASRRALKRAKHMKA